MINERTMQMQKKTLKHLGQMYLTSVDDNIHSGIYYRLLPFPEVGNEPNFEVGVSRGPRLVLCQSLPKLPVSTRALQRQP